MRIALVHDYLNQYGGAERVLEAFCEVFPEAPIYTLFYDKEKTFGKFSAEGGSASGGEGRKIITSFLDNKIVTKNHRLFIPLMPLAASLMKIGEEYDVILSSSAGYGKGIGYGGNSVHVAYCHTPLRYAWESKNYFNWNPIINFAAAPVLDYLRSWDFAAGQKPDLILANSNYIADKIKRYYQRDAKVLHPPVDLKKFYYNPEIKKRGFFLAIGRLMHYKKFDFIVKAFKRLDLPLVIAGEGPELKNLKKMASSKIHFLPFLKENELQPLYNAAEALIFPQVEDFGLVAAEAQACGTPVIAFNDGGAKEIVHDGITGVLFNEQTPFGIEMAVKKLRGLSFDRRLISRSAQKFSKEIFKEEILDIVNEAVN